MSLNSQNTLNCFHKTNPKRGKLKHIDLQSSVHDANFCFAIIYLFDIACIPIMHLIGLLILPLDKLANLELFSDKVFGSHNGCL